MKFAVSFITFFHILLVYFYHCIYGCMFCMLLFKILCTNISYVFLLLCMFLSRYSVSLCYSVYCLCVNVDCTFATVCQPNCS